MTSLSKYLQDQNEKVNVLESEGLDTNVSIAKIFKLYGSIGLKVEVKSYLHDCHMASPNTLMRGGMRL